MARRCPECGSDNTVTIVYGMPGPELFEASARGDVVLGGCCISLDENGEMPNRACRECSHEFTTPRG